MTFGAATSTGLSSMLEGSISHDKITRFLADGEWSSSDLWKQVKLTVRNIENEDGVLIFDDTIQEKRWIDENDLICWHYYHCKGRSVKGINMLNCLYHVDDISIPVAFDLTHKPIRFSELKTRREKRRSELTKNELMRAMIDACMKNRYNSPGFCLIRGSVPLTTLKHIKLKHKKEFIGALKNKVVCHIY